nr:lytic murein transglycosylase [Salinimonas profundi]
MSAYGKNADADEAAFSYYIKALKKEAVSKGYERAWLDDMFNDITFRPTVVKADKNQPEKKITLDTYLATRVPDWKVAQAVTLLNENQTLLSKISREYGVQPRFIIALWGNESNFGKIQGNHDVLSALSSLAFEGRRETLFKKQFFAALKILSEGHITRSEFSGSWAGAMGQSQFMPTSFLTYAVDYDKDGKKDIWQSKADVFASIANYLKQEGWSDNVTWGRQVTLHQGYRGQDAGLDTFRPLSWWQAKGVRKYDGSALPDAPVKASLIKPDGLEGRIYLVYTNFHTLMKWNRSQYFGVSVGYLSDRIKKGH